MDDQGTFGEITLPNDFRKVNHWSFIPEKYFNYTKLGVNILFHLDATTPIDRQTSVGTEIWNHHLSTKFVISLHYDVNLPLKNIREGVLTCRPYNFQNKHPIPCTISLSCWTNSSNILKLLQEYFTRSLTVLDHYN